MTQQTMTEKDMLLATWAREFDTTVRVLKAYPAGKDDFKPAPKSRTARELAWIFVMQEKVFEGAGAGKLEFTMPPGPPPVPVAEIIRQYESTHREVFGKLKTMTDAAFSKLIQFPVGPKKMGDVRAADAMWMMVMDNVHHRGQLSIYLRLVGANVPNIYGGSADEPWQ